MPVFVLAYWLVKGIRAGTDSPEVWEPVRHTLLLGSGAALLTVALALPLAVLSTVTVGSPRVGSSRWPS
jgi:ABC-type Fe3+ transport system permease subunit